MSLPEKEGVESTVGEKTSEPIVSTERAKLNVSGITFEIRWETLRKFPKTRLGSLACMVHDCGASCIPMQNYCDGYDWVSGEIYFERDPNTFASVLYYYGSGRVHIPRSNCVKVFEEEAKYWGIPFNLEPCCDSYFYDEWECAEWMKRADYLKTTLKKDGKNSDHEITKWKKMQSKIWNLFEHPETSTTAKIVSIITNLVVVISTFVLCLNTHPDLQTISDDGTKGDNPVLAAVELVCIIWFTFEYLVRLISCPSKKSFLTGALNTIDLLAVLPYYIGIIIDVTSGGVSFDFVSVRRFIQILRLIRIVRIFKLARHSTGLQVIGFTIKESSEELSLLALLLMMGVTLFASLVYYAEEHEADSKFKSIIEAFWWAAVSMTTVGYGDMTPQSTFGKIIGSLCCVSGILFIALPIPTIVGNFSKYYSEHRNKQKIDQYKTDSATVPPDVFESLPLMNLARGRRTSFRGNRRSTVRPLKMAMGDIEEI